MVQLVAAVDEACAAGVLIESGNGLAFRHPLIRTALYEEMPTSVRAAWHREAARALSETDAPADRIARQLLAAIDGSADTEPIEDWILRWLAQTARLLTGQAPRAAAELLSQAVTRSPAGSSRHDALVCRLAEALFRVGDGAEAERVASRALAEVVEPDLLVDLHWTLAQCRALAGRSTESLTALTGRWLTQGFPTATGPGCWWPPHGAPRPGSDQDGRPGRHRGAGPGHRGG